MLNVSIICEKTGSYSFLHVGENFLSKPIHEGTPCMRCIARAQATNIFFENARLFGWDCEHTPCCCCNCTWWTKFCHFLHEHKGNIVCSLDLFSHSNSRSQTAHPISVLKIMFAPMFASTKVCRMFYKINLLHTKDAPYASSGNACAVWSCVPALKPLVLFHY